MGIYLDNHATTQCDPRVLEAMLPIFMEEYGNPASLLHQRGNQALSRVENARRQIALLLGSDSKEVIFSSGATESNNLAIMGLVEANSSTRNEIVTSPIEHKSVLETCKAMTKFGYQIKTLEIDQNGLVDLNHAKKIIGEKTLLVTVQTANNEIGTIQNIYDLAQLAHNKGALFHTDAAQAIGKINIDVRNLDVDLLSISGHKVYGPKGVGALFIRGGAFSLPIKPIIHGGGQEWGLRAGTLNVPGIVGLGIACNICQENMESENLRIKHLRDSFEKRISGNIPHAKINGAISQRLSGNSNITLPIVDAEILLSNIPDLELSLGSACNSGALEPSYVLTSIGLSREEAYRTFRLGIGRFTTESDIDKSIELILDSYNNLVEQY